MNETPRRRSVPDLQPARRAVLKLIAGAGLALPVGTRGTLRTGVQIVPARFREDMALDAGEIIEAAEGIIAPIDPAW